MANKISLYYLSKGELIQDLKDKIDFEMPERFVLANNCDECDILVSDFDFIDSVLPDELLNKLIVLTDRPNAENVQELMFKYSVKHLIGSNSNILLDDFLTTVQCIVSRSLIYINDLSNDRDTTILERIIICSDKLSDVIDDVVSQIDFSDFFDSPASFVKMVADELLTNAIYNAPVNKDGTAKFESLDRKKTVNLTESESVKFRIGKDHGNIFISVEDQFGRLSYDKVVQFLNKCTNKPDPSNKEGGAGLGLYLVYSNVNRFILFTDGAVTTKIIAIIENTKRYNSYRKRITSFHYYTGA